MKRRRVWHVGIVISLFGLAGGGLVTTPSALASPAAVVPAHSILCTFHPDAPFQFGPGGVVFGEADIACAPSAPDISITTIKVWRYDANRGTYYVVAQSSSSHAATKWTIGTQGNCTGRVGYLMHTEVINESFHGNWFRTDVNSSQTWLLC